MVGKYSLICLHVLSYSNIINSNVPIWYSILIWAPQKPEAKIGTWMQVVYLGSDPRKQVLIMEQGERYRKATIYVIIEVVTDGKEDQILLRTLRNIKLG